MLRTLALVTLPILFACNTQVPEKNTAEQDVAVAMPQPAEEAEEAPNPASVEEDDYIYTYSPIGKQDPFRTPFVDLKKESDDETDLQKWELDQLRLIAVVTGPAAPYAMVVDPNGKGHVVRRGTLIGTNWGRIKAISERRVVIREELRDWKGTKITNDIKMVIPKLPRPETT